MTSRRTHAPVRDTPSRILDAAIDGLRRRGVAGAALNDLVTTSGAPRGSLYHHFPGGKTQIVCAALEVYGDRVRANFERALASATRPGDKIRALFALVAERLRASDYEQSCGAGAVALDVGAEEPSILERVRLEFSSWIAVIEMQLPIADEARRRAFASFVLTSIEGAYVRGRAERSVAPVIEAGEWLAALAEDAACDGPSHIPVDATRRNRR